MKTNELLLSICVLAAICLAGCTSVNKNSPTTNETTNTSSANENDAGSSSKNTGGSAETGVEKVKPAPGTGNVQGKVMYNGKPAENIEVKLCEKFNQFFVGCSGKTHTARTDKDGDYVIANVAPMAYEGLLARVFETGMYVFAAQGIGGLRATNYEVVADKTLFVAPTNLFKSDLKVLNPKAGSKVSAQNLELKWGEYPDAAYYKFSIYPNEASVSAPYVNERVEATTFAVDKPLQAGGYRIEVEAFNAADQKLSESSNDLKFTITEP